TMFSITRGAVLLAVSSSPDPTLPWRVYTYQSEGCPDQPYVGVSSGLVILSANTFTSCLGASPTYAGAEHWVIGKAGLVSNTTNHFVHFSPDPRQKAVRPVHSLQPGPGYMVSVGDGETISTNLTLFEVQGVPPEPVTLAETVLTLHPFVQPRAAPQPSTTLPLDTVDSRIHDAFWDGSSLWLAFGSACPPEGNRSVRACLRIAEVDPSAALVRQDFAIADPDRDLFFAALRTDSSGNLIIPFAYSSESEYAGLMVTSHAKADPPNTFRQPVRIRAGTGADPYGCDANRCRYGDYFGAARDPVDPSLVWIVGEASMSVGWQTAIAGVGVFPSVGFTVSYSIVGGGTGWSPPMFTSYQAGLRTREPLPTSPEVRRLDRDSPWTVPAALDGSSAEERWATNSSAFGIAAEDLALPFLYVHQVWANVSGTPLRGGTVSPGSSWLDNGTFVDLRATPSAGWKFIGWTGEGAAAYSGVENPARITASGPIREVGEFWPGLTVSVTGHGSVLFTYRNITGIVEGGTTRTLYVPPGTSVLLSAAPSALSRFSAWSGAALSPINAVSLVVDGPLELGASFADDYFVLFTLVGPGAAITGVAAFVLLARRRRRRSTTSRQLTSASGPQEPAVSKRRSDGQGEFHR
ncbi:MAG TPA: hypothetical protein VFA17_08115, partial [Thermoplasmata archaeon]|nr:hypothetical protein [Thermoplasmata archaeon]